MLSINVLKRSINEFIFSKFKKKNLPELNLCIITQPLEKNISICSDDSNSIICIFNNQYPNTINIKEYSETTDKNSIFILYQ